MDTKETLTKFSHMIHGGDYNPDQWLDYPEIINEDMRLIPLAHCNTMTINIFSWTSLEPEEGVYDFSYLDNIVSRLGKAGINFILATPSGARPAWMSATHPEVLRVNADRTKNLHGVRHNHCYTSPYYRKKVYEMNTRLAERYKDSPSFLLWHISNEYGGECHCELCQNAFREWLKAKYDNNLDKLNEAYWAKFWSHTYTDWEQIESPSPLGEMSVHGLNLDWKRFVTHQTIDFIKTEIEPIRKITPDIPVTTNLMGTYSGLDYFKVKDVIDVVSWDSYPEWHLKEDVQVAQNTAFVLDLNRSLKNKPFLVMECTPSLVNWRDINKAKKPGMHMLSAMQMIAHGAESVQYFQWRKSRGSAEKFHGAVVDHCGHENTRVFREVAEVGRTLEQLDDIIGTNTESEIAIIFDWENRWAVNDMQGMAKHSKMVDETCKNHYNVFWNMGINVDVIDSMCDFEKYKIVIAPMLYLIKPEVEEKIKNYVTNGGIFVGTYCTGWVDENDLCFLGGFPGGSLKDVFGLWMEEIDTLLPNESNCVKMQNGDEYKAVDYCEIIHPQNAEVLANFKNRFYAGMPAFTCNNYGKGKAFYIAFRDTGDFLYDFYGKLVLEEDIKREVKKPLPCGVTVHTRQDEKNVYAFFENYTDKDTLIELEYDYTNVLTNESVSCSCNIHGYGSIILKRSL